MYNKKLPCFTRRCSEMRKMQLGKMCVCIQRGGTFQTNHSRSSHSARVTLIWIGRYQTRLNASYALEIQLWKAIIQNLFMIKINKHFLLNLKPFKTKLFNLFQLFTVNLFIYLRLSSWTPDNCALLKWLT